ncbi:hypothetical protein [Hymenobacter psoromatis]|uniref:hypothetical protein n=1 Tax=Hymenobacter psoromatis TaxID=1484116 RepID=UPI001CBED4F6|nr:hypothetical protein [Hymenobacter psoromatis]
MKVTRSSTGSSTFLTTEGRSKRLVLRTRRQPLVEVSGPTYTVTATAYQAVAGQTDDEPFVTADNSHIQPNYSSKTRWMALSQDLLARWGGNFQYGDKVWVSGISPQLDGLYTVHDTMNKRHHHCLDILTHPSEKFDIFTKGVKLRLARLMATPLLASQRRPRAGTRATAQASNRAYAKGRPPHRRPPFALKSAKRADYFASVIL